MHEVLPVFREKRNDFVFLEEHVDENFAHRVEVFAEKGWRRRFWFLEESFHHNIGGKSKYVCKTFITFIVAKKGRKARDLEVVFIFGFRITNYYFFWKIPKKRLMTSEIMKERQQKERFFLHSISRIFRILCLFRSHLLLNTFLLSFC